MSACVLAAAAGSLRAQQPQAPPDEGPPPSDPAAVAPPAVLLVEPEPLIAGPADVPPPEISSLAPLAEDEDADAADADAEVDDPSPGESAESREPDLPAHDGADLDGDRLRHLAATEPAALGALSIGTPDGGLLFNPVPMPEGALWTVRDPRESFGTVETVESIARAITAVEERHPGSPRLVIGDISRPDGGRLNRHRSHQTGRDADIGLYLRTGEATTLLKPGRNELDLARTWSLIRAFVVLTDVERIFLDRAWQRSLYAYALAAGEDRAWLDDLFARNEGRDALIQHERRHQDHMHVRFFNPSAQEKGRLAYPLLLAAGLVPGPTMSHRVRSGETLSHLARQYGTSAAAIRRANGLKGSSLRAGRTYVIPVRKLPPPAAPLTIPPRRLPPGEAGTSAAAPTGPEQTVESDAAPPPP